MAGYRSDDVHGGANCRRYQRPVLRHGDFRERVLEEGVRCSAIRVSVPTPHCRVHQLLHQDVHGDAKSSAPAGIGRRPPCLGAEGARAPDATF